MAAGALWGLVAALETHRGRDRAVRALSYGCQLAGAALPGPGGLPGGLLAASAQLSSCRTALRLFDDLAMLRHSCSYGLGPQGEDALVRGLSVLSNVANQLYYPCEHLAWAADVGIVRAASQRWWTRSTALWGCALLLGILRYGMGTRGLCPAPGHPAIPENFVPVKKKTEPAQVQHFTSEAAEAESPGEG
ncbi:peroxisomal membrane protein 11C isoform X5 [Molothrus ater]|uniref:peroxisomal membrane protein 11C isoform X5 n=1 Tax=Molothrus ater TaxID=84834 RepID=UPI00174A0187|nr:peroxisomal membrane protein 11C isoform X5 [Molothrus ater]